MIGQPNNWNMLQMQWKSYHPRPFIICLGPMVWPWWQVFQTLEGSKLAVVFLGHTVIQNNILEVFIEVCVSLVLQSRDMDKIAT